MLDQTQIGFIRKRQKPPRAIIGPDGFANRRDDIGQIAYPIGKLP